jgi:hypothetical protein
VLKVEALLHRLVEDLLELQLWVVFIMVLLDLPYRVEAAEEDIKQDLVIMALLVAVEAVVDIGVAVEAVVDPTIPQVYVLVAAVAAVLVLLLRLLLVDLLLLHQI